MHPECEHVRLGDASLVTVTVELREHCRQSRLDHATRLRGARVDQPLEPVQRCHLDGVVIVFDRGEQDVGSLQLTDLE